MGRYFGFTILIMRKLIQIVTFMAYPELIGSPKVMLLGGSRTIALAEKQRYFAVRKVSYDESLNPMFAQPDFNEKRYVSLEELRADNSLNYKLFESPILQIDNWMKEYDPQEPILNWW
jgi:hypothetical protein